MEKPGALPRAFYFLSQFTHAPRLARKRPSGALFLFQNIDKRRRYSMAYGYGPTSGYPAALPGVYPQMIPQTYVPQMGGVNQMNTQQPSATLRLVTSRDEATTAQIPFDNTINVFVNLSAGEVYIKRFNPNTGGAVFTDYLDAQRAQGALIAAQESTKPPVQYATVEQLTGLEQRVSELAEAVASRRTRGAKADE